MEHLLIPHHVGNELDTKKICDLHKIMKENNQFSDETTFIGSHKEKFSDFTLLENMRKRRQKRLL